MSDDHNQRITALEGRLSDVERCLAETAGAQQSIADSIRRLTTIAERHELSLVGDGTTSQPGLVTEMLLQKAAGAERDKRVERLRQIGLGVITSALGAVVAWLVQHLLK